MTSTWKIALGTAAALLLVPIGCSLVSTTASVTTAPGRVVSKTLETNNIIGSYEGFFNRKAAYDARVAQIDEFEQMAKDNTDPAEAQRLRIELSAMRQSCRDIATTYNADSAKANKSIFRDGDLPLTLSESACNA